MDREIYFCRMYYVFGRFGGVRGKYDEEGVVEG